MKSLLALFAALWLILCGCGCDIFNSGPRIVEKTLMVVGGTAETLVSKMDPQAITASADGQVTNPEFLMEGVAGTGVYWKAKVQMIGGQAGFKTAAAGDGLQDVVDQDVVNIFEANKSMSKDDWERAVELYIEAKKAEKEGKPVSMGSPTIKTNEPMAIAEPSGPAHWRRALKAKFA